MRLYSAEWKIYEMVFMLISLIRMSIGRFHFPTLCGGDFSEQFWE